LPSRQVNDTAIRDSGVSDGRATIVSRRYSMLLSLALIPAPGEIVPVP
jgi:hypothetical protein